MFSSPVTQPTCAWFSGGFWRNGRSSDRQSCRSSPVLGWWTSLSLDSGWPSTSVFIATLTDGMGNEYRLVMLCSWVVNAGWLVSYVDTTGSILNPSLVSSQVSILGFGCFQVFNYFNLRPQHVALYVPFDFVSKFAYRCHATSFFRLCDVSCFVNISK